MRDQSTVLCRPVLYCTLLYYTVLRTTRFLTLSTTLALEDTQLVTRLRYFVQIFVRNQFIN